MGLLSAVRADERRATLGAMGILFGFMAAHAMLETARDALFLAEQSATRLPWVYLAIAFFALLLARLNDGASSRDHSKGLGGWLLGASIVTLGFWGLVFTGSGWVFYALYVWSGVVATLILLRFWLMMGQRFSATEAKRIFAVVGTGSVVGAIAGSAAAAVVASLVGAHWLLLFSAAAMAVTAMLPRFVAEASGSATGVHAGIVESFVEWLTGHRGGNRSRGATLGESVALARSQPYVWRVGLLVLVSTSTLTIADYVFKSAIDLHVSADQMGTVLAVVYLGLNILSLFAQVFLIGWFLRVFSVTGALAVLPLLLLGGGVGLAVAGGLVAAIGIKAADGALRHSLHRTTAELLYVPMTSNIREAAKGLFDVLGQRGGQALASMAILGLVALGANERLLGIVLVCLALLWVCLAIELRRHYLNLFRGTLKRGLIRTQIAFPEFDVASLESLMAALNSDNDGEVLAALDILAEQGKIHMVQVFILFHPSAEVVIRAAGYFADADRTDFCPIARRRMERSEPEVQARLLLELSRVDPDDEELARAAASEELLPHSVGTIVQIARRTVVREEAVEELRCLRDCDTSEGLIVCALALTHFRAPELTEFLINLAGHDDVDVRVAAASAMAAQPNEKYFDPLLELLKAHETRELARKALAAMETPALEALEVALTDTTLPKAIRHHLPRTIIRFEPQRAADILLGHVPTEPDGVVRFKILRGLSQLRLANPRLRLDRVSLERGTEFMLARAFTLLDRRLILQAGAEAQDERATSVQALLVKLLRDKEKHAIERLMKTLSLQFSAQELDRIWRGLSSIDAHTRSSSKELLENLLPRSIREPVLALVDDAPDADRLARAGAFRQRRDGGYEGVLRELLNDYSESIRSLVVYHVGELGLHDLQSELETLEVPESSVLRGVVQSALERLTRAGARELAVEA